MFRPFTDLNLGFSNAENYQRRENKELLAKYFVRDEYLERILDSNVFYLIGEKGTGKTAYATYLANTDFRRHKVSIFDVRQTEYQKFLELKKQGHLPLSQYLEVWRVLLLMAAATSILHNSGTPDLLKRFTKLQALKNAIDDFYQNAFAPEIVKMINFVESGEDTVSLMAKYKLVTADFKSAQKSQTSDSAAVFQTNLLKLRKGFEEALSAVKLDDDALIFIDGIDVRPSDIAYADYFDCVRGLIEGVWAVNKDFLGNIKDSVGRIRIVLLVRPDTFVRTGLHNLNTKLRDNSVFLNWITSYKDYRGSLLFKVADRLLSAQQSPMPTTVGESWDYYFPFHAQNIGAAGEEDEISSFLAFLRFSYYRPRDITSMMDTIQDFIKKQRTRTHYVTAKDFSDPSFRDAHAEYLLGEIRDQLLFYYSQDEYNLFLQFFLHLRGKQKFTYDEFVEAFNEFITECNQALKSLPQFFDTATVFLQFLYEQNVICYKERDAERPDRPPFIRWCFRERTLSNMAPKVRVGVEYEIFYGLSKALNVGRQIKVVKGKSKSYVGSITSLDAERGFGFIRGGAEHNDYYFKISQFVSVRQAAPRVGQKVSFEVDVKYAKPRAVNVRPSR